MTAMAGADRYSRLVLWLKVALPLVALGILSTLFLVAKNLDPQAAIPYAKVDVERLLQAQGMTRPSFGGVTQNGLAISVAADAVQPSGDANRGLTGTNLSAVITVPDSVRIDITGPDGTFDGAANEITIGSGARLETSTGYLLETDRIIASLDDATVTADSEVLATGPGGTVTSGGLVISQQTDGSYRMVFSDGVRLIYEPGS